MSLSRKASPMAFKHEKIPGFLKKTYALIENKEFDDIVAWTQHGDSFIIYNLNEFSDKVLPAYFKHKNFASFVRQLNSYDFHKIKNENDQIGFFHKLFRRGHLKLLSQIKRKAGLPPANANAISSKMPEKTNNFALKSQENNETQPIEKDEIFDLGNEHLKMQSQIQNLEKKNENLERLISVLVKQNDKQTKETENLWKEINKNKLIYDQKIEKIIGLYLSMFDHSPPKTATPKKKTKIDPFVLKLEPYDLPLKQKSEPLGTPNLKYLNKVLKKSATQTLKSSINKDIKSSEQKFRKILQSNEFLDPHSSHIFTKRTHGAAELEDSCENDEETPVTPNIPKKKVKKLKEKTSNLTSSSKNYQAFYPDFQEFSAERLLLKHQFSEEESVANEPQRKKDKGFFWEKERNYEKFDNGVDFGMFQDQEEVYEDLLGNLNSEGRISKEMKREIIDEEDEDNQIDNEFENNAFIDEFNGFNYNNE